MKPVKYIFLLSLGFSVFITGCNKYEDPLDTEQYQKIVYLVGANQSNNEGLEIVNLPYQASPDAFAATYIAVATGGSQNIDKNLTVQIEEAGTESIDKYNSLYLYKESDTKYRLLNNSMYSIPEFAVQLNAGEVYGRMPLGIKTAGLHCDSLYALTFKIGSVSDPGYAAIRKTDSVLMFTFRLFNNYSGIYQESGRYYKYNATTSDTVALSLTRTFKAVNVNTVRFYHLAATENKTNIDANGVTVKINSDNTLAISAWGSLVINSGGGTYDPATGVLDLWYNYMSGTTEYRFKGVFTRSGS